MTTDHSDKAIAPMHNLSVPEMLQQVAPGQERVFPPTGRQTPGPQRFLEVTRNFERDALPKATSLEWINFSPDVPRATTGGLSGRRVSLLEAPEMKVAFVGNPSNALDYYDLNSDVFFVSEKLKLSIESIDPDALEFREIFISGGAHEALRYYAAMPRRVFWGVDTALTEVKVINDEYIPGHYDCRPYYGDSIYLKKDIPEGVHIFKDIASVYAFWSKDLIWHLRDLGVTGLRGVDPSRRSVSEGIFL